MYSFGNQNEIYQGDKNIGKLIDDPTLVEIGKKYNKTGAQVALGSFISFAHLRFSYRFWPSLFFS